MNANFDFDEMDPNQFWLSTIMDTPELSIHLLKKIWILYESDKKFHISDNPIVKQNIANNLLHRGNLGINSEGVEIYFPICPSLVLCLFCEKTYSSVSEKLIELNDANIENVNSLQVIYSNRFIFSSQNDFELAIDMISKGEV